MAYDKLPLEGRGAYAIKLAAGSNKTEAQTKMVDILQWQLEKEFGVHYAMGTSVLVGKQKTKPGRYPHLVAVYEFGQGKVSDIRTRQEEIARWVLANDIIMAALDGWKEAQGRYRDIVDLANSEALDDWKEKELHDLVETISAAVPDPPPEAHGCCKLCSKRKR